MLAGCYANIRPALAQAAVLLALAILAPRRNTERKLRSNPSPGAAIRRLRPAVLLAALACGHAAADAALQFRIADVDGDGWRARGVSVALQRDDAGRLMARVSAARLELPPPIGPREEVEGECTELVITPMRFSCLDLVFGLAGSAARPLRFEGRLDYRRDTGALAWSLQVPADGRGQLAFSGGLADGAWTIDLAASDWAIDALAPLAEAMGQSLPQVAGRVDVSLYARGTGSALLGLVFELDGTALAGGNEQGTIATDGLALALEGSAWPDGDRLAFDIRGTATSGEVYLEPVYASLADRPLRLTARGHLGHQRLALSQLVVEQQDTAHIDAAVSMERSAEGAWRLVEADVRLPRLELPNAYTVFMQPFLGGTALEALDTSGLVHGDLEVRDGRLLQLRLDLAQVNLDDTAARLAIYGLSGRLAWNAAGQRGASPGALPLDLRWSGGFVYGIPFGAARIAMDAGDGRWSLVDPVSIPLLDGALEIGTLEIGDFTTGDDTLVFDARLTPVDMRELSRALDWPPLSGRLSGTLPRLSHADGVLSIGGELMAEVFSGTVSVRDLRIERPLQPRAHLRAEVELQGLELMEVTEALSFGLMTGRLDGYVRGLEMIDWAPVAFDARLYTPADDAARRRISQRAVDNIANLGGGGAGALSTGFLRFFEDFSYDAFALGCRLERDVCEMSGLEPRDRGYLILRGRGLPRIDVMGFAQRVSWSALVEQLAGITESGGPEIR